MQNKGFIIGTTAFLLQELYCRPGIKTDSFRHFAAFRKFSGRSTVKLQSNESCGVA